MQLGLGGGGEITERGMAHTFVYSFSKDRKQQQ